MKLNFNSESIMSLDKNKRVQLINSLGVDGVISLAST